MPSQVDTPMYSVVARTSADPDQTSLALLANSAPDQPAVRAASCPILGA